MGHSTTHLRFSLLALGLGNHNNSITPRNRPEKYALIVYFHPKFAFAGCTCTDLKCLWLTEYPRGLCAVLSSPSY